MTTIHPAFIANICGTLIPHPEHEKGTFKACPLCFAASEQALADLGEVSLGDRFVVETAHGSQTLEIVKVFENPDEWEYRHGGGYYQIRWADGHLNGMSRKSLAMDYFAKREEKDTTEQFRHGSLLRP